jgi:hypothetical protein
VWNSAACDVSNVKPSAGTRARQDSRSRQWPPIGVRYTPPVRMRRTGGTFSMSGTTPCSPHVSAKQRRKRSTAGSSTPPEARSSSGVCGMNRWMVRTGEPIAAANRALRAMPARASSSSRSTRTNAPLGQATGASAVSATSLPEASTARRTVSAARSVAASSATSPAMRHSSRPAQGPPASRSATWSASGAALSSGMEAEPVDICPDRPGERPRRQS